MRSLAATIGRASACRTATPAAAPPSALRCKNSRRLMPPPSDMISSSSDLCRRAEVLSYESNTSMTRRSSDVNQSTPCALRGRSAFSQREQVANRARRSARERAPEIRLRRQSPQPCSEQRAGGNGQVAHEVVRADELPLARSRAVVDDQRLARRLTEFLEPAHDEREGEPPRRRRPEQRERKEREEDERDDDERFAPVAVRKVRGGNEADHRGRHLERGEKTEFLSSDRRARHGEDHDPRERDAFAEADEDVRQEQVSELRAEITERKPELRRRVSARPVRDPALHQNRGCSEQRRDQDRLAHAAPETVQVHQYAAEDRPDHDRD